MRMSASPRRSSSGLSRKREAGMPTADACRKHGLNPATFDKLKTGMAVRATHFLTRNLRQLSRRAAEVGLVAARLQSR